MPGNHTTEYSLLHSGQLKKQLSGSQVESLLDFFLFQTIEPLLQTLWFKNELALIANSLVRDAKRKTTRNSKKDTLNFLSNIIASLDKKEIIEQLKLASLDRELLSDLADSFNQKVAILLEEEENFFSSLNKNQYDSKSSNTILELEDYFGLSRNFLVKVGKEVKFWYDKYIQFKYLIISKYYRLAFKCAKITKLNKPNTDVDCLFKSLILAVDTALNKYTSGKGALTSYIQLWFKSTIVNPKYDFEMGRPFRLSNYGKQKIIDIGSSPNAISIDDEEFSTMEFHLDSQFLDNKIEDICITNYDLIKFLDSVKNPYVDLVKLVLNIPEINEEFYNQNCKIYKTQ